MVTAYLAGLALLGCERLVELRVGRRHAAWARARGGIEVGHAQFRVMTAVHVLFFAGCAVEVLVARRPFVPWLGIPMLAVALGAQTLRWWAVATLGPYWNVRVIVVPGAPVVTSGPYRFIRHPNYAAVVLEGLAVPLVGGAWITAAAFTVANAILLHARIRCEEAALVLHCDYAQAMARRPRFVPSAPAGVPDPCTPIS